MKPYLPETETVSVLVTVPLDGRTATDVAAAVTDALSGDDDTTIEVIDPSVFATLRDFTGRTPGDYQQFDQSNGPVIGATLIADAHAGDVLEVDLNAAQAFLHGWYVPTEAEDPTGERFDAVVAALAERTTVEVVNRADAPGAEPDTIIYVGDGDARVPCWAGQWVVFNRKSGSYETRSTDLRPLPAQRVLTTELVQFLTDAVVAEVVPADTTADIAAKAVAVLQREGVAHPFSPDALLLGDHAVSIENGMIDVTTSPPHWYVALIVTALGGFLDEHPDCNYIEMSFQQSWARPDNGDDGGPPKRYPVIVCRPDRPSPHELRQRAEAAVAALIAVGDQMADDNDPIGWIEATADLRPPTSTPVLDGPRKLAYEWHPSARLFGADEFEFGEFTEGRVTYHAINWMTPVTEAEFDARERRALAGTWADLPPGAKRRRFETEAVKVLEHSLAPQSPDQIIRNVRTRSAELFDGWTDNDSSDASRWIADAGLFAYVEREGWELIADAGSGHGEPGPQPGS